MRWDAVVACALLAGCGRVGFEARSGDADADSLVAMDGAIDSPGGSAAMHVQNAAAPLTNTASLVLSIGPSTAGNLLVVGLTQESGTTASISQITDNAGNAYASANARAIDTGCNNTSEIWYAPAVTAGATMVTVKMSASVNVEGWVIEASGLASAPLDGVATVSTQPSGSLVSAPSVMVSRAGELVVSVEATCGGVTTIHAPFTKLAVENGEDTAYYVTTSPGTYGAVWDYGGGTWNASTAAFK